MCKIYRPWEIDTHTHTQSQYSNPCCACMPRVTHGRDLKQFVQKIVFSQNNFRVEREKMEVIGELHMEKVHSRDLEKQNERLQKAYDTLSKQYSDLTSSMKQMQQRYVVYSLYRRNHARQRYSVLGAAWIHLHRNCCMWVVIFMWREHAKITLKCQKLSLMR